MWKSPEPRFDVASAICQGGRDYQEDAVVTDFPAGADSGLVVLADGMGGHAAGDVASKIVVTEVYSDLKFESANFGSLESKVPAYLESAASNANTCINDHVKAYPETRGMGATLVSLVMVQNRMYWMSIGDSPLYILRKGKLRQLNEDHSLGPQIDFMVKQGLIGKEEGLNHPDRNCLTSVILGDDIAKSDCPTTPFPLEIGDVVVVSSDGLQYLETSHIEKILYKYRRRKSSEIVEHLLKAIYVLADPDQDNVSLAVIKLNHNDPVERVIRPKPSGLTEGTEGQVTRLVADHEAVSEKQTQLDIADEMPDNVNQPKVSAGGR